MQPRRIARELALLSIGQFPTNPDRWADLDLQSVMVAVVRTLTGEVEDALETASAELKRSRDRLLDSELRTVEVPGARAMVTEAIELSQTAINRLGAAIELPEFVQLTNQQDVRDYAVTIMATCKQHKQDVDQLLEVSLEDWQLNRLAQIDQNILRIAVTEIVFLDLPKRVAINEAVELAKRYSSEDGHRFINGVLRRVTRQIALKCE